VIARIRDSRAASLWPWLPVLAGGVWLLVFALDLRETVQGIYTNADLASALVIGELYDERVPGDEVVLGNYPWYSSLWIEDLTRGFPAHRQLWQIGFWLLSLGGVALVAWSTWRASSAWAAAIAAVLLVCAGYALLPMQLGANAHGPTNLHVALLGTFLVWCASRRGRVGPWPVHVVLCAVLAAVTAAGLASDRLLLVSGIAPFVGAAIAMAWMLPAPAGRRIAVSAVTVAVAAMVGSGLIVDAMRDANVQDLPVDVAFAPFDRIVSNFRLLLHALTFLGNGDFGGAEVEAKSVFALVCAIAVLAALVAVTRWASRWVRDVARRPAQRPERPELLAHASFWILAGTVTSIAFVMSTLPIDKFSARYLMTAYYALAALVPLLAVRPRARAAVAAGTTLVVAGATAALVRGDLHAAPGSPSGDISGPLLRLAQAEGVEHGYAGFWTAAPLTWQMKAQVRVYPVASCTGGPELCRFKLHYISSWYRPRPNTRSFLIIDPHHLEGIGPSYADPKFGPPQKSARIGDVTVHIYGYDIASRFHGL